MRETTLWGQTQQNSEYVINKERASRDLFVIPTYKKRGLEFVNLSKLTLDQFVELASIKMIIPYQNK